ncbi:cyclic AMP-dependent transcription factor ATF-7-like isoform X2 [Palaemon carinicauda]|uniref:cyclic AMP-dependent transcription factor ATF-7-like isoform X2 n=1 Tax=Palaemon carinicauda TaxID=392227 RepID=UPI0035B6A620
MGEVDKPFGCPQPGCGMSFTNEDHLVVHRRRHEMQLMVNGDHQTPSLVKHGFFIDQTPTPTRFLRQCEEVGLFQEISLNPFDEQFRRASLLRSQHSVTEVIGGNAGESLNTPRVLPPVDSDETISSTSRDDISGTSTTATSVNLTRSVTQSGVNQANYTRPQSSARVEEIEDDPLKTESNPRRLSLNVTSASEAGQNTGTVISTPTPVITAGPSVTQSLGVVNLGGGNAKLSGVTQPSSQQSTLCTASSNIPPSPSATVLQLLLRLPNGQAIPVEIPATPVVSSSSSSTTTGSTISTVSTSPPHDFDNSRPPQQSLAKMKLKQALASSSTAARPGCSKTSRANTADRIAEMTRSRNFSGTSSTEGEGEDESTNSSNNLSGKGERRRRNSSDNEDPLEKRRKFLERNRAAAIRCREKKKKWIENLSIKYDELGAHNLKLQTEVSSLRSEVAVLKSMLLQHKDCPVTLAMQGEGSVDNMSNCDNLAPIPSVVAPLSEVRISSQTTHKPRTRSLSLPSIPSSTVTSVEPLPVNLSSSTYTCPASSSVTTSVSSSTKVGVASAISVGATAVSMAPVNLTNNLITNTTTQHPTIHYPANTNRLPPGTIVKVPTQHTQLLVPASASQLGKMTVVGGGELVVGGTSNVIVATVPSQVSQGTVGQPHLLNLTLHHSPQSKSSVLHKSN